MCSKCHKLYAKVQKEPKRDEYGRISTPAEETWEYVCPCRCDDADARAIYSSNGELVQPKYHIVCEGNVRIKYGTEVRCNDGDSVRGKGTVIRCKNLNFLPYTEIWI